MSKDILKRAQAIGFRRSEEKERGYGPFQPSMAKAARIAADMSGKHHDNTDIMYISMIAQKLSRESHKHKEDSILDILVYLARWNEYQNEKE